MTLTNKYQLKIFKSYQIGFTDESDSQMNLRSLNLQPPVNTCLITCHTQSHGSHNRIRMVEFQNGKQFPSTTSLTNCFSPNNILGILVAVINEQLDVNTRISKGGKRFGNIYVYKKNASQAYKLLVHPTCVIPVKQSRTTNI